MGIIRVVRVPCKVPFYKGKASNAVSGLGLRVAPSRPVRAVAGTPDVMHCRTLMLSLLHAIQSAWAKRTLRVLKGSWDLVTRVINKVTLLKITYNPN